MQFQLNVYGHVLRIHKLVSVNVFTTFRCRCDPPAGTDADGAVRTATVGLDVLGRMAEAVSGVSRMRDFRRYVADTAARRLVQLWMDIEKLQHVDADDARSRWLLYREIQITFYEFHEAPSSPGDRDGRPRADSNCVNCVLVGT